MIFKQTKQFLGINLSTILTSRDYAAAVLDSFLASSVLAALIVFAVAAVAVVAVVVVAAVAAVVGNSTLIYCLKGGRGPCLSHRGLFFFH